MATQKQSMQQHEDTAATRKQRHWWWQSLLLWTHKRRAPLLYFSLMHCQFYKPTRLSHLEKTLQLLGNNWRVPLQWTPATAEFLEMNKQVLMWAAKKRSPLPMHLWFQEKCAYDLLSRPEQVIMVRICCAFHCSINCNYENTVHKWIRTFICHSPVMLKEF